MKPNSKAFIICMVAVLATLSLLAWAVLHHMPTDRSQVDPVEHYRAKGDKEQLFTALYERGMELSGEGNYIDAMLVFSEAAAIEEKIADQFVKGELYEQIGSIYSIYNDYEKAFSAFEKAAECYKNAGAERQLIRAYFDLGSAAWRGRRYEQGEMWIDYALRTSKAIGDRALEQSAMADLIMLNGGRGRISKACELIEDYDRDFGIDRSSSAFFIGSVAEILARKGKVDHADKLMSQAWSRPLTKADSIGLYKFSSSIAEVKHAYPEAMSCYRKAMKLQHSSVLVGLQHPVLTAQNKHLNNAIVLKDSKIENDRRLQIALLACLVLVGVVAALSVAIVVTRRNASLAQYRLQLSELKNTLEHNESVAAQSIDILFKDKYALINKMASYLYDNPREATVKHYLYNEIMRQIDSLSSDSDTIRELEEAVDRYAGGAMKALRTRMPSLSEKEYRQVCYHLAGFSVNVISLLMKEPVATIYKRRSRLRSKMVKAGFDCRPILACLNL